MCILCIVYRVQRVGGQYRCQVVDITIQIGLLDHRAERNQTCHARGAISDKNLESTSSQCLRINFGNERLGKISQKTVIQPWSLNYQVTMSFGHISSSTSRFQRYCLSILCLSLERTQIRSKLCKFIVSISTALFRYLLNRHLLFTPVKNW